MLATLIATSLLHSQALVVTYVSTKNDRFPNFYPGSSPEKAKEGPQYFEYENRSWEVEYVDGEYVAIDLDATELAMVRKFAIRLKELATQISPNKKFADFELNKDCPLAIAATWPQQSNLESLVANGRVGITVEAEFGDRNSSNTLSKSGTTLPRGKGQDVPESWIRISDLNLSLDKGLSFNPPWKLSVSSFDRNRNTEAIKKRQKIATEHFWRIFERDRATARESFDHFIDKLKQFDTPLAHWQSDFKGKDIKDLPPGLAGSLTSFISYGTDSSITQKLEEPYVKYLRIWLTLSVDMKQPNGQISGSHVMIDRP